MAQITAIYVSRVNKSMLGKPNAVRMGYLINVLLSVKFPEGVYEVDVLFLRIGGNDVHLSPELCVEMVGLVHDSDDEHLDAVRVGARRRLFKRHGVTGVGLPVRQDHGHLPHAGPRGPEQLVGPMDGAAREGALAEVGHLADGGLDVAPAGLLLQADHHHVHVAEEHHAHASGFAAHHHAVDERVHEVLHQLKVLRSHALRAVYHKHQLQRAVSALEATAWQHTAGISIKTSQNNFTVFKITGWNRDRL